MRLPGCLLYLAAQVLFMLVVTAPAAFAWDSGGHEVISTLAYDRLNPKARQAVDALSQQLVTPGLPYNAITMACWMDDLRRNDLALPEHGLFFTWHYIDLGIEAGDPLPSFQPGDDNAFHGNVVQALKRAVVVLEGGTDPYIKTKAIACAIIMHLVGDIHQPLHAATHYFWTAGGWRHHDAGGNKEYVVNGPADDPKFNLHAFWDSAWRASFDDVTGLVVLDPQFQEYGAHDPGAEEAFARTLPPPSAGANLEPDFDGWAEESHQLAQDFVYREITATENKKYCRLSSGYVAKSNALARQRLVLAGERLAVLLNETLGAANPPKPPPAYPPGPPASSYESSY
jgi:hypothetical protein